MDKNNSVALKEAPKTHCLNRDVVTEPESILKWTMASVRTKTTDTEYLQGQKRPPSGGTLLCQVWTIHPNLALEITSLDMNPIFV